MNGTARINESRGLSGDPTETVNNRAVDQRRKAGGEGGSTLWSPFRKSQVQVRLVRTGGL